jgi:hypothetical protein
MDSFYTKKGMGILFTYPRPVCSSVQFYVIEHYSSKDHDILKVNWSQVLDYIHNTLDDGVALNGDEYEPDYEQWAEIRAGK